MKKITALGWCSITPEGFNEYDAAFTKRTRKAAIELCEKNMERPWRYLYNRGWRIVRVEVKEK